MSYYYMPSKKPYAFVSHGCISVSRSLFQPYIQKTWMKSHFSGRHCFALFSSYISAEIHREAAQLSNQDPNQIMCSAKANPKTEVEKETKLKRAGSFSQESLFKLLTPERAAKLKNALDNRTRKVVVVLDQLENPHNVAAIARSCDAFGIQDVHVVQIPAMIGETNWKKVQLWDELCEIKDDVDLELEQRLLNKFKGVLQKQTMRQVSKGADKWLTWNVYSNVQNCVDKLRSSGYKVLISNLHPDATPIDKLPWLNPSIQNNEIVTIGHEKSVDSSEGDKIALVFGNEAEGVSKDFIRLADAFFTVPMYGFVESFNVSVAVAVSLAIATVSLRPKDLSQFNPGSRYFLSEEEKTQLLGIWALESSASIYKQKRTTNLKGRLSVTSLGIFFERRLLQKGVFCTDEDLAAMQYNKTSSKTTENGYLKGRFCLERDRGMRFDNYLCKRRSGCLAHKTFAFRSESIITALLGTTSLFTARAFRDDNPKRYTDHYTSVLLGIQEEFAPYFDEMDNAINPHDFSRAPEPSQETILPLNSYISICADKLEQWDLNGADESILRLNSRNIQQQLDYFLNTVTVEDLIVLISEICDIGYENLIRFIGGSTNGTSTLLPYLQESSLIESWSTRDTRIVSEGYDLRKHKATDKYSNAVLDYFSKTLVLSGNVGLKTKAERDLLQMWFRFEHCGWNATEIHRGAWRKRSAHGAHFRRREQTLHWCRSFEGMIESFFNMGYQGNRKETHEEKEELEWKQRGVTCVLIQLATSLVRVGYLREAKH